MTTADPQFFYMILALPALFGLTLVGYGLTKIFHEDKGGFSSVVFGFLFIGVVIFALFFFQAILSK